MEILARCLAVVPEITRWRNGESVAGMVAADALDQAHNHPKLMSGFVACLESGCQGMVQ